MKSNQIKAGAVLSMIGTFVSLVIPFFYTPVMLQMLGQAQYGLYGIAQSFMQYLNLLNFGIGGTVVRYMVKYRAIGDVEGEERILGLFMKIYAVIGTLILICGFILSFNLKFYSRSLSNEELETLKILLRLMTMNTALFLPLSPLGSIVIAHEKFIFNQLTVLLLNIASPIVSLVLLYNGFGVIGLTINSIFYSLVIYIIYGYYVSRKLKIRPRFSKAEKGILKEILNYSLFVFIAEIVDILYWSTDKLIIGWAQGTEQTAIYNVGSNFNSYFKSFSAAISGVLMPKVTSMAVKDTPKSEFTVLFIKVGRIQFVVLGFALSAFIAFGKHFIGIWVGTGYAEAYWVALLVLIPIVVPLIQNTGLNMLYALNKHRFRSLVYAGIAVVNVVLTFLWVEDYGIIGASMATCIAYIIGQIIVMNWYYYKKIEIDIPLFWKNIVKMSPVPMICGSIAWFILDKIGMKNWNDFLLYASVYTIAYVVLAYKLMLNDYEKNLIQAPLLKIRSKIGK